MPLLALGFIGLLPLTVACESGASGRIDRVEPEGQTVATAPATTLPPVTAPPATIPPSIVQHLGSYECNEGTIVAGDGTFRIDFTYGDEGSISGTWRIEGVNDLVVTIDDSEQRGTVAVSETTDEGTGLPETEVRVRLGDGDEATTMDMTVPDLRVAYIDFRFGGQLKTWSCNKVL